VTEDKLLIFRSSNIRSLKDIGLLLESDWFANLIISQSQEGVFVKQLKQRWDLSLAEADPSATQKQRPSLIRQLALAYSICAGLILITLISQRIGMPILSRHYQEGMERLWMLRLSVKQLENDLASQANGLRGYLMSGQPEFLETLTSGRERYLTDLKQAQALAQRVGDTSLSVTLDRVHQLAEQWYQTYSVPNIELRPNAAITLGEVLQKEERRNLNQLHTAFAELEEKTHIATQRTQLQLQKQRRNFLIIVCSGYIIGVLIGLVVLIRSTRQIRQPLELLISTARQIGQGDFSIRVSGDPYVETAAVAQAFNRMASEIAAKQEETEGLLQSLRQKNVELEEEHRQVEQANQFKSQFFTNITHELRTPLSSMVLYADMLMKGKMGSLTPAQHNALDTILRRGKEQLRLINELLDASRLDAKELPLTLASVSLTDLVREAITIVQPQVESKRLQFEHQFPPDPIAVEADRSRLLQVLNNLLENAAKFTPLNGRIQVSVIPRSDEIEVVITNTGEGIDPQDLPFIFERFYRGRSSDATDSSGAGLGLYIAKELVELHGGRLRASSSGEGKTTFSFTLLRQHARAPTTKSAGAFS
jgi:signal transduction histidine kinase